MGERPYITVVSGLPRSGTSLMMQMIHAGGIPAVTDELRTPDTDNPRGYYEFEKVKQVKNDKTWLPGARGRVVKMVHLLLLDLPPEFTYRVVFMRRNLEEVLKSQSVMLERQGKKGAALPPQTLMKMYQDQIDKVLCWMGERPNFQFVEINYNELVKQPQDAAERLSAFLSEGGSALNIEQMVGAVDPSLYRNRA